MKKIKYSKLGGYKYRLEKSYSFVIDILPENKISHEYFSFEKFGFEKFGNNGFLYITKNYAWDGPSGPAIDTSDFMRGSLIHDVLYQAMRLKLLPLSYRKQADDILYKICREDGMPKWRASYVYWAVRLFAGNDAKRKQDDKIYEAP